MHLEGEHGGSMAVTVSACIANYNGTEVIRRCLDSILSQECTFYVEVLVHDDASTDDSAATVARDYPTVRLMRTRENVGFCVSNNRLVEAAQGEFVLLLNNDANLRPAALGEPRLCSPPVSRPSCLVSSEPTSTRPP